MDEIRAAELEGRKLSHPDLWHAVIFYTTGELVRRDLPTPAAKRLAMRWLAVLVRTKAV